VQLLQGAPAFAFTSPTAAVPALSGLGGGILCESALSILINQGCNNKKGGYLAVTSNQETDRLILVSYRVCLLLNVNFQRMH